MTKHYRKDPSKHSTCTACGKAIRTSMSLCHECDRSNKSMGLKVCNSCRRALPFAAYRASDAKGHLRSSCKPCERERTRTKASARKAGIVLEGGAEWLCRRIVPGTVDVVKEPGLT